LRYQLTLRARAPWFGLYCLSIGDSSTKSCGTSSLRHEASSKPGAAGAEDEALPSWKRHPKSNDERVRGVAVASAVVVRSMIAVKSISSFENFESIESCIVRRERSDPPRALMLRRTSRSPPRASNPLSNSAR